MSPSERHNAVMLPLLKLIAEATPGESDQWVVLESLALGIGKLNGRTARQTAIFVETIAERLAEGSRDDQ